MDRQRVCALIIIAVACLLPLGEASAATRGETAPGKPLVYNHISEAGASMDQLVHQTYDAAFQVVDFKDGEGNNILDSLSQVYCCQKQGSQNTATHGKELQLRRKWKGDPISPNASPRRDIGRR